VQPALQMPFPREGVLNISPFYADLRDKTPIFPVITPAGDPAWIVVSYNLAKSAFADRRLGYFTHHDPANASRLTEAAVHAAPMGNIDFEEHTVRMRKLLAPSFTPRRLALLAEWIQQLVDKCLDAMEAEHNANPGQPVDFHEKIGFGLPVEVIGALMGFPQKDSAYVTELSERMGSVYTGADAYAAAGELRAYMEELIAKKRDDLGPDLISDLIRAEQEDPDFFKPRTIADFAAGFVFPGHETTVTRMDIGMVILLSDLRRRDWLMEDPEGRVDQVVEEVTRMVSATNHGLMRYALEDVDIGGAPVKRGDLIIISESAANRDPAAYDRPDDYDPTRHGHSNLAFGHGPHKCLGMSLAKMELRKVFVSLFRRFPNVRLAIDPSELHIDNARVGGGVNKVPLIW
jgi:cytochrome P450